MIDPAEIAELRHAADRAREREHAGLIDAVTLRVPTIDALLDAAERCTRLEALLREAAESLAELIRFEYDPQPMDDVPARLAYCRALKVLESAKGLQPTAQLDAADRESREDEQRDDHDDRS